MLRRLPKAPTKEKAQVVFGATLRGPGVTFAQLSRKYLEEFESEEAAKGATEKSVKKTSKPATREDRKAKR